MFGIICSQRSSTEMKNPNIFWCFGALYLPSDVAVIESEPTSSRQACVRDLIRICQIRQNSDQIAVLTTQYTYVDVLAQDEKQQHLA